MLAPLRELIEALAERPAVTEFYSYSSLWRLCFTASSHFPWVDSGLPIVWRADHDYMIHTYHDDGIEPVTCDLSRACATIEARLAASPVRPFFGSEPNHQFAPLADALARRGSALHPAIVQHGEWPRLEVANGSRRCEISHRALVLHDGGEPRRVNVRSLDEAARAICEFLDT